MVPPPAHLRFFGSMEIIKKEEEERALVVFPLSPGAQREGSCQGEEQIDKDRGTRHAYHDVQLSLPASVNRKDCH